MRNITDERLARFIDTCRVMSDDGDGGTYSWWVELTDALTHYQSLRAQGGVSVKPLQWTQIRENHWRADTAFGPWEVCNQPMFGRPWRTFSPTGWKTYHGDDPKELKRLAEQEVSKRILSSLEASPAPVSELVEASCPGCHGTGDQGGNPSYGVCDDCNGTGKVNQPLPAALAAKGGQRAMASDKALNTLV